jgi:hypothetical protein
VVSKILAFTKIPKKFKNSLSPQYEYFPRKKKRKERKNKNKNKIKKPL